MYEHWSCNIVLLIFDRLNSVKDYMKANWVSKIEVCCVIIWSIGHRQKAGWRVCDCVTCVECRKLKNECVEIGVYTNMLAICGYEFVCRERLLGVRESCLIRRWRTKRVNWRKSGSRCSCHCRRQWRGHSRRCCRDDLRG